MQNHFISFSIDASSSLREVECNTLPTMWGDGVVGPKRVNIEGSRTPWNAMWWQPILLQARINAHGNQIKLEKLMSSLNAKLTYLEIQMMNATENYIPPWMHRHQAQWPRIYIMPLLWVALIKDLSSIPSPREAFVHEVATPFDNIKEDIVVLHV